MNARESATEVRGDRVTTDTLMADLRVLAADTEQLLRATADQTGHQAAQVRARAEESLRTARSRLADLQDMALARTRAAGRATDTYVRANAWPAMAICVVAGLALGFLLAPHRDRDA
jgi:ElaB/YqjD/DUF883 family membrane-anchored ribosome-binding protein